MKMIATVTTRPNGKWVAYIEQVDVVAGVSPDVDTREQAEAHLVELIAANERGGQDAVADLCRSWGTHLG